MNASPEPLLRVENLGRDYAIRDKPLWGAKRRLVAVDRLSFEIHPGETLGVVGESGCGKSTLGRMVCRLEEPSRGEIVFQGRPIQSLQGERLRRLRPAFQPVFQDPLGSLNPRFTLRQTLAEPLRLRAILGPGPEKADGEAMRKLMEKVGLGEELLGRYPHQLSGGQRQRLGLARALAMQPDLLVADEPLSSLDVSIQAQILNLILDLQKNLGLTILFISHDLRVVGHLSDRVLIMYLGRIMELAPVRQLFSRARHPYTQALFKSLPRLQVGRGRKRSSLSGERPTPIDPPPGCRFYSRCPYHQEACLQYENELLNAEQGHTVACRRWTEIEPLAAGEKSNR